MKVRDVKISSQLKITQLTVILLVFTIGIICYLSNDHLFDVVETTYNHPIIVNDALSTIKSDIINIHVLMEEAVLAEDIDEIHSIKTKIDILDLETMNMIDILKDSYLGPKGDV